ncbi:MAG: hypothetical protein ACI9UK_001513 [Candidatus Krumholzibacteriia bacterium]
MAKKKSPAELKTEGELLGKQLTEARKKQLNFALSIGKDGLLFETDLKKNPDVLWRNAKKAGGGAKGGRGFINVKGKVVELTCDDDSVPKNLSQLAKKFFTERGQAYKFIIKTPSGEISDDDDEEELVADASARKRASDEAAAEAQSQEAPPEEEEVIAAVEEATEDAIEPEVAQVVEDGGDPDEALRGVLQKEFDDLKADIDAALLSTNAGAAKKAEALRDMFASQISGDVKKTASVMTLLKTTVKDAIAAGTKGAEGAANGAADPAKAAAAADRLSKMAELEKGVDALLAEFA